MTVWNKPVSWSKFKLALICPRQLQYVLDYTPPTVMQRGWHQALGKAVQKVFELFYNQGLWKNPKLHTENVLNQIARRVITHPETYDEGVIYDQDFSRDRLSIEIIQQVESGRKTLQKADLLTKEFASERGWGATFQNLRLYGMIDFIRYTSPGSVAIYDGKGSQEMNADVRQLVYYALILWASGLKVDEAALIYWKHEQMLMVEVTPAKLREFVDTDYQVGLAVFQQLKEGVGELPTKPSKEACQFCSWKNSCKDSRYYKADFVPEGVLNL